jgi:positive regulator of sigma E activity
MIERSALVTAVQENGVLLKMKDETVNCAQCPNICGMKSLNDHGSDVFFNTSLSLKAGDEVLLSLGEKQLLAITLSVYLIPLVVFLLAAIVVRLLGGNEPAVIAAACITLLLVFALLKQCGGFYHHRQPVVLSHRNQTDLI